MEQENLLNNVTRNYSIDDIQEYIRKVINIRGFGDQPMEQRLLLLTEEVGELAKAIRKNSTNMGIDKSKLQNYDTVENEIADVFIVLASICNGINANLFDAIVEKEKININRNWDNRNK